MMYAKGRTTVAGRFSALCFAIFSAGPEILLAQPTAILPAEIPLDVAAIYQPLEPAASYGDTTEDILDQMVRNHYSHIGFDDAFSSRMLDSYIESLDGGRMYFYPGRHQRFRPVPH
jgi:hypothetical protein